MPDAVSSTNGASSLHDLLALSDEQILEIDPEPQDVEVSGAHPDAAVFDELAAPARPGERSTSFSPHSVDRAPRDAQQLAANSEAARAANPPAQQHPGDATDHGSRDSDHETRPSRHAALTDPVSADPPQWLADRMSDPQIGAEARELWNTSRQAHQEAAAFREVFAKPDDARSAAQRARLLDDIDRAYFAGDATQRAQLAASMLHEDPAAFREMVFAGLRALESAGQGQAASAAVSSSNPATTATTPSLHPTATATTPSPNSAAPVARAFRLEGLDANGVDLTTTSNIAPISFRDTTTQPADRKILTPEGVSYNATNRSFDVGARHAAPQTGNPVNAEPAAFTTSPAEHGSRDAGPGSRNTTHNSHALAAYPAFERTANEDLERTVGTTIDRTLDQALPHATRTDSAAMKSRLAATIRQDVERALQGDRQLGEQVAQILAARRFDNEARAQVVRLIGDRAQQLVPGSAKRVLSEWTQTTLTAHRDQRERSDAANSRREVVAANSGGANSSTTPRATTTAASAQRNPPQQTPRRQDALRSSAQASATKGGRGVDYRRLSDEQILDL